MKLMKKNKTPRLDPKMDQAVKAAYELGLMDGEESLRRKEIDKAVNREKMENSNS
jgi:hypothetical protein